MPQTACAVMETAAPSAGDRRVVRTRKALRDALIALIEERGLDGFTVNDLCVRADINRGTFYNHFHDKEECLLAFEGECIAGLEPFRDRMRRLSLADVLRVRVAKQPLPVLVDLFAYLREQGDFLHAVLGPGGDARFGPRLREMVCTGFVMSMLHDRYRTEPTPFVGYYTAFFAAAYLGVIMSWIDGGMKESPEEMAQIALRLLFIKPGDPIKL